MLKVPGCWRTHLGFGRLHGCLSWLVFCICCVSGCEANRDPVSDPEAGQAVSRIVTLAPHLTELVFTAGAGDRLVGVVEYSDYPPESRLLPRVGDAFRLDYEAIAALKPDLILGWQSGTPAAVVDRLTELGYRVVTLEPGRLQTIAEHIRIIGELAHSEATAAVAAHEFERDLEALSEQNRDANIVSVFYQISWKPLFTINRRHVIGEAIEVCGGRNIFADVAELSPAVSLEAVLDREPQVIIASQFASSGDLAHSELANWSKWANVPAVRDGNLFLLDADQMARPSIRILGGVRALCETLNVVRGRSGADGPASRTDSD